jgi:hypothetical protein
LSQYLDNLCSEPVSLDALWPEISGGLLSEIVELFHTWWVLSHTFDAERQHFWLVSQIRRIYRKSSCSFLLRIDSTSLVDLPTIFDETSFQQGAFMIPLPPCTETSFTVDRKCFVLSILVEYFSGSLLKFSKRSSPSLFQPVPIFFVVVVVSLGTHRQGRQQLLVQWLQKDCQRCTTTTQ